MSIAKTNKTITKERLRIIANSFAVRFDVVVVVVSKPATIVIPTPTIEMTMIPNAAGINEIIVTPSKKTIELI